MKLVKNFSIGADPELFLERDGQIISAEGLIGGTKEKPKAISKKGHYIQEDNVMVEYNIPPAKTAEEFVGGNNTVLEFLKVLASLQDRAELNFSASAELDPKYLKTEQAKRFGCEPDYNVWERGINEAPGGGGNLRTCGGHIHIGYDDPNIETSEFIIKAMDMILGLESLVLDKDTRRREMYGKAGAFRFKKYGVEYRTLSNFWIGSEKLMTWAFNKTVEAIELVNSGLINILLEKFEEKVPNAINRNDGKVAESLLKEIYEVIEANKELIKK